MEVFLGILPYTLSFNAAFPYVNLLSLFSFVLVKKICYTFAFHFRVRVDRSVLTNITSAIHLYGGCLTLSIFDRAKVRLLQLSIPSTSCDHVHMKNAHKAPRHSVL